MGYEELPVCVWNLAYLMLVSCLLRLLEEDMVAHLGSSSGCTWYVGGSRKSPDLPKDAPESTEKQRLQQKLPPSEMKIRCYEATFWYTTEQEPLQSTQIPSGGKFVPGIEQRSGNFPKTSQSLRILSHQAVERPETKKWQTRSSII